MTQPIDARTYDQTDGSFPGITIEQLLIGEQLVIWAFRKRLAGKADEDLARGFKAAFGLAGVEAALAAFRGIYDTMFHHCSRDLGFHSPRCRCVSSDEIMIVTLIAANHSGMAGHAAEIARCLVEEAAFQDLLGHAASFAFVMERFDLRLPLRPLVAYGDQRPASLH